MTQENFTEVEERIFALLDNAEQTQAQARDLLTKLTGVLERLESSEQERTQTFAEAQQRAAVSEKQQQQQWADWKAEQTKLWQAEFQQKALDWEQSQTKKWQDWQFHQVEAWQDWRNQQQSLLLTEIKTVTQSANAIITKLDDKVKTVNLTVQNVNTLIQNGTAQAIEKLVGDQFEKSIGQSLSGIVHQLNRTDEHIQASESSAKRLKTSFIELESSAFDTLQNKIEAQVKTGVETGLTAGLADSTETITQSLKAVETTSLQMQDSLVSEFKTGLKQALGEVKNSKQSVFDDIYTSRKQVNDNSAKCIQSLQQVKAVADESVADVKQYHADLVNKGHKRWVLGWTALLTLLVTSSGVITYKLNQPDYVERDRIANDIIMLLQQKSAIENSYTLRKTKAQDGKFYTWVDKSDCIDGDYCRAKEPTAFTTPTSQQIRPPQPITPPVSQSTQNNQNTSSGYQSSGSGQNMYSGTTGATGNPFGESKGKYDPNPYKNP